MEPELPHWPLDGGVKQTEKRFCRIGYKMIVHERMIRLTFWNIRTLKGKGKQLVDTVMDEKLLETIWANERYREYEHTMCKLSYIGEDLKLILLFGR